MITFSQDTPLDLQVLDLASLQLVPRLGSLVLVHHEFRLWTGTLMGSLVQVDLKAQLWTDMPLPSMEQVTTEPRAFLNSLVAVGLMSDL
jgi:hypothetical protein